MDEWHRKQRDRCSSVGGAEARRRSFISATGHAQLRRGTHSDATDRNIKETLGSLLRHYHSLEEGEICGESRAAPLKKAMTLHVTRISRSFVKCRRARLRVLMGGIEDNDEKRRKSFYLT